MNDWTFEKRELGFNSFVGYVMEDNREVAVIYSDDHVAKYGHLISAAPDLLSALQVLLVDGRTFDTILAANDAIAKAKGILVTLLACLFLSACSGFTKGGNPILPDPTIDTAPSGDIRSLALIVGEWTGSETASVGESGSLTAIFDTAVDPTQSLSIRLIWWSERLQVSYRGTARGTLGNLTIQADADNPAGGTRCGYQATAALNTGQGDNEITFSYTGTGAAPCPSKAGRGVLRRQGPPPCVGGATLFYPGHQFVAVFPPGFVNPWYPFALASEPFAIPAGAWQFAAVTGDEHSTKQDGTQLFEVVKFLLYGSGDRLLVSIGPTVDVPDNKDEQATAFGVVILTEPVVAVKAMHGYVGPPVTEPTYSVYPLAFTYGCPSR